MIPNDRLAPFSTNEADVLADFGWNDAPIIVLKLNRQGVILSANEFACRIFPQALPGLTFNDMLVIFDGPFNWFDLAAELAKVAVIQRRWNVKTADNLPLEIEFKLMLADDGVLVLGAPNFEDMLRLRRAFLDLQKEWHASTRESLKSSYLERDRLDRRYQLLLTALGEGVIGIDTKGCHSFVNPAATAMLGYGAAGEMEGQSCHDIWCRHRPDGSTYPENDCPIFEVLASGISHGDDNAYFLRKDGSYFPVEYICSPLVERKRVTGAVLIFKDITERLCIQQQLYRQHQDIESLLQRERWLRGMQATIANINQLLLNIADLDELFVACSQEFVRYPAFGLAWIGMSENTRLGYALAARMSGSCLAAAFERDPAAMTLQLQMARQVLEQGRGWVCEDLSQDPDQSLAGQEGLRSLVLLPIVKIGESSHIGLLGIYSDTLLAEEEVAMLRELVGDFAVAIDAYLQRAALAALTATLEQRILERTRALHQAIQDLAAAKDAADAANQAKSQFLATMSHELRTPLNAILGFTQLLTRSAGLTAQEREYLNISNRSGQHLLGLINTVLELAKIEAGRVVVESSCFDFHGLLDDIIAMFLLRADEKAIFLRLVRSPQTPRYLQADQGRIRQILINLISNAIKFTERGGIELRVDARPLTDGNVLLHIEVEDSGSGLSDAEIANLFQPFEQTHDGRKQGGTGLGLMVSREYARLMGGDITSHGKPGLGSTFVFSCQVKISDELMVIPGQANKGVVVGLAVGERPRRILVVDDNEPNRFLLRSLLETVGFEVKEADDGLPAVIIAQTGWPDLIFMDVKMPKMDGREATRRIRTYPKGKDIVIIALSASVFEEDRSEILAAGCNSFLRKPVDQDYLFEVIASNLQVNYRYQELTVPVQPQTPSGLRLTPEALLALPRSLREALLQALIELDTDRIDVILVDVERFAPGLSEAIRSKTQAFKHEHLVNLLELADHQERSPR